MPRLAIAVVLSALALLSPLLLAQEPSRVATLLNTDNRVEVSRGGGGWSAASAGQVLNVGDKLRTGEDSRATVRMGDGSVLQLDELTTIEIKPPQEANSKATLDLPRGSAFFFSRGKSHEVRIETPAANGAIRGTAFVLKVTSVKTEVSMIEGEFALSNSGGSVTAHEGQNAGAGAGATPSKGILSDLGGMAPWYLVLENHLGQLQPLRNADRAQFLAAVPDATKRWRMIAPQLAGAATIARREWAREILRASFEAVGPDCGMRARILRSVIAADPQDAVKLLELAISLGPDCAGEFSKKPPKKPPKGPPKGAEDGGGPPGATDTGNYGNPPGLSGQNGLIAVCHHGVTIFLTPEQALLDLKQNKGDTLGACQVTPVGNP